MYDALLIVSFGGPEQPEDVLPFLENVTRGRSIPRERLLQVAEHYYHFGGKSPINDQCRALVSALRDKIALPIYWGNRNWHPFWPTLFAKCEPTASTDALAFVTSAYSSYSGCRQYRENLAAAQTEAGVGAPAIDKLRAFYNHPGFVEANAARMREALMQFSEDERADLRLIVTAHSIPSAMAESCAYQQQLRETAQLAAREVSLSNWDLAYQSRSGPPAQPWLGPDILDYLRTVHLEGVKNVLVAPLGFTSDHLEVLYDLDVEARELANQLGIKMVRAATAGTHPAFLQMICELVEERLDPSKPKRSIGVFGPNHDYCPRNCCPAPQRPGTPRASEVPSVSQQS